MSNPPFPLSPRAAKWPCSWSRLLEQAITQEASRLTRSGNNLQPAFIQINEFEHRLHRAGWQADLGQTLVQSLRSGVAPAAFGHKRIPYFNFLRARLTTMGERPREQLRVAAAFECF